MLLNLMAENIIQSPSFRFNKYLVTDSTIRLTGEPIGKNVQIKISPEGEVEEEGRTFTLILRISILDESKNLDLNMLIKGFFEYDEQDREGLLPYLCENAPAILFPYVRAYVSNITALGGGSPIILPTLNLIAVGKELREKLRS